MIEPVDRERLVAAIKAAVADTGETQSNISRLLGKKNTWVGSVLTQIRDGHSLTIRTVEILKQRLPTLVDHLRAAGWYGKTEKKGRSVVATRSVEHLNMQWTQLVSQRDKLNGEILAIEQQIADITAMVEEGERPTPFVPKKLHVVPAAPPLPLPPLGGEMKEQAEASEQEFQSFLRGESMDLDPRDPAANQLPRWTGPNGRYQR